MRFKPYNEKEDMIEDEKPSIFKNIIKGKSIYQDWWDRVSQKVKDWCATGHTITKEEYLNMRGNSYDWKTITPILSTEALINKVENSLKNMRRTKSRYECDSTYDDAMVSTLVPVMLDRLEQLEGRLNDALQLLDNWQTGDPKHHYESFDPDSLGCITRSFMDSVEYKLK